MFDFAETTKNMTPVEILNYYRNLYYAEPQVTERGIVANAINDILPNTEQVVRCKDCKHYIESEHGCNHFGYYLYTPYVNDDDFCSYGERKDKDG